MANSPQIEQYRDALTLHLVRNGAPSHVALNLVRETGFELAAGHPLAQYGGRFYTQSQVADLGAAMGFALREHSTGEFPTAAAAVKRINDARAAQPNALVAAMRQNGR